MQWRAAERIGAEAECEDRTGGVASGVPAHIPRLKRARGTRSSCPIRMPDAAHRIPPPTMAGVTPANIPTHAAAACEAYGDEAYGDEGGVCDRFGTGDRVTELGCGMETHWVDVRTDSAVFSLCGWLGEGGSIGCHASGRIEESRRDDPGPSRSRRDS